MRPVCIALILTGCGTLFPSAPPPEPPTMDEGEAILGQVIDAGMDRDWERLCGMAFGTCDEQVRTSGHLAPTEPPEIMGRAVQFGHPNGGGWTTRGVHFVLCGENSLGQAYESEVFVIDAGDQLLAAGAVFWTGTRISLPNEPNAGDFVIQDHLDPGLMPVCS